MVDGRDGWGISRQERGAPVKLIVYPGAYHAFDGPGPKNPIGGIASNSTSRQRIRRPTQSRISASIGAKE